MQKNYKQSKQHPELKDGRISLAIGIAALLLLACAILAFISSVKLGALILVLVILVALVLLYAWNALEYEFAKQMERLENRLQSVQNEILLQMPIGIILFNPNDNLIDWVNPYLLKYFDRNDLIGHELEEIDEDLAEVFHRLYEEEGQSTDRIQWQDRFFDVGLLRDQRAMYFMDVTKYGEISQAASNNRMIIGHILVDNYDEIMSALNDRRKSTIDNYMTKQLSTWGRKYNSFVKELDDDRFLLIGTYGALQEMEEDKFQIIDTIREATSKWNFPLTLSIGISYREMDDPLSISEIGDQAQANVDLALSRGGDQVVIKVKNQKARYYGGKTNPMVKRTHVRSRQIANTIAKMMQENQTIFVMGHDYPDMDAIGACVGIRRIAQMNNSHCYIVVNEDRINQDIKRVIEELRQDPDNAEAIISPSQAEEMVQPDSLVFLVDVHRPSITVAPELIEAVNGIVVIDHHRKGEEVANNILLEYIEPYASSACELITEFFEYQNPEGSPVNRLEATIMLAGITVDSRNFSLRTGSRTFDAASYLKSNGADSILIQEFLKEDLNDYIDRSQLIESVQYVEPNMGIAQGPDGQVYSTVIAAQAADTLLSMNGIAASFVVFQRNDGRVGISARSMGNVNVQTIMEELGGGGHLSNAATQISDVTVSEAVDQLKAVLAKDKEE
ncbi:DHH family phosphoesterase [Aerococcus sanguinicola]|uniref:Cyclic-di-AMP phosphodiesterase n=1 Tax=Aerococcus sanguinicola TaxID=119206 RepID=A0A0X8FAY1_9LACT|nr:MULTISPECIES: DHH family phosphoesterase [Aerococcus]AMB93992.1 hypothetical protein AWM72_04055 [Aerococcus sanguinicola]MDK7050631.1 DHH family phosphoesterase [Aerococcus sanguinicola]OFT93572.1 hypothetical protein HMPREF3090_06595 [Aerococcus sp. HMSC23C02]PKZ20759.1 DHH family phosphoesterase [Aerococcus sanguinicola]